MTDNEFAIPFGQGFVSLRDHKPYNGAHFVRADHISAIRPCWNDDDVWIGTDVFTLDGRRMRVNATVEQILQAIADEASAAIQTQTTTTSTPPSIVL